MADRYRRGITGDDVMTMLNNAYNLNARWEHITGNRVARLQRLAEFIRPNQATIASYGENGNGHYFAVFNNGERYLAIDPQSRRVTDLFHYLDGPHWGTFFISVSDNIRPTTELVTREIVDSV